MAERTNDRVLRVLVSAYACEPERGSESAVGWNWAIQAATFAEVWVLTRANNRSSIENALRIRGIPSIHFVYHDLPKWMRFWKRGRRGVYFYYLLWQLTALPVARRLHRDIQFDVGHHLTLVSMRLPSFLAWLNIPYVWGPIGGGEQMPLPFYRVLGISGCLQEAVRRLSTDVLRIDPAVRMTARRASEIIAVTQETRAALPQAARAKTIVMPAIGQDPMPSPQRNSVPDDAVLRIAYVGGLLHWKGLQLALPAIAAATRAGVRLEFTVIGDGPFRSELDRLVIQLGIADSVDFAGKKAFHEVQSIYHTQQILLFPSLHDSGGFVVLEAMAAGLPVICLNLGGPSQTVTDETGCRIRACSPEQTIEDLAAALVRLARDPGLRASMGSAGRRRAQNVYCWDRKADSLRQVYGMALRRGR